MTGPIPSSESTSRAHRRLRTYVLGGLVALVLFSVTVTASVIHLHHEQLADRLLVLPPDAVPHDPALVRFAMEEAKPVYASHCAACHGADMRGTPSIGAPNLADHVWLYDDGSVSKIERTLLYGIRSGQSKAHNITDMPPYGLTGRLREDQIRSLVQYLFKLDGRPYQVGPAEEGHELYFDSNINCADCHDGTARGNSDYGAPNLTINVWNNGGDPQSLYDSIYFGRHRIMPAWLGTLSLGQIRALAVYLYAVAHTTDSAPAATAAAYGTTQ